MGGSRRRDERSPRVVLAHRRGRAPKSTAADLVVSAESGARPPSLAPRARVRASARMPAAGRVVTVISFSYTAHLCEPQWHIALEHAAERLHAHSHIRDIAHEPSPATHLPPPRDSPAHRVVLSHSARPSPSPPPRRRPRALSRECAIEVARLQARGLSGGGLALRGERHGAAAARRGGALRAREGEPARWHIRPLRELHEPVGW